MAVEGRYDIFLVSHAADELLGLVMLHLAATCTVIDFKACGQRSKGTENSPDNTGCPYQPWWNERQPSGENDKLCLFFLSYIEI